MTPEPEVENVEHREIAVNGVRLHVAQAGPEDGPPVLLLHGFPDFWWGWRHQIPALARAGFRVWAPDQRGYNRSDKPRGIAAYRIDVLAADILGLIEATGRDRVHLIGHDWGGAVAWWLAGTHPRRVGRMVVLNSPHNAVFRENLRRNPRQMLRSWYILFFQLPWLPEALARAGRWRGVAGALRKTSRPGTFRKADIQRYRRAWSEPGAYTAMLNWYRALRFKPPTLPRQGRIPVPTLLVWGARDVFLGREMAAPSIALCKQGELELIEEATHWVHNEEPDRVNQRIVAFLRGG